MAFPAPPHTLNQRHIENNQPFICTHAGSPGSWSVDWASLNAAVQSFADADTPYVWSIPNASSVELISFVLGDRRPTQDRKSALLSFTPAQLKETAAPWTHTVEGDQDVLSAIDVPEFYNWTIKSRVITGDVLEITFNSVHRDNGDLAAPDLGVDTFGGIFSLSVRYASTPTLTGITTARFQPDTFYAAGSPIIEPNPADNFEPYIWSATVDFTSGPDPDFDGTGFDLQEKAPVAIGTEIDITGGNATPKTFAGLAIDKAIDQILDNASAIRLFRPTLALQLYGHGTGQLVYAIDLIDGKVYAVRDGATVTSNDTPSLNPNEWELLDSGITPRRALADLQAIPFPDLVASTGLTFWLVDTHEEVTWDTNATPENVAPRRTYSAAQEPVPFAQGKWVVTSPQPSVSARVSAIQYNEILAFGDGTAGIERDDVNGFKGADAIVRVGAPFVSRIVVPDDTQTRKISWAVRKTVAAQTFIIEARDNPNSNSRYAFFNTLLGTFTTEVDGDGNIAPDITPAVVDDIGYWIFSLEITGKSGNTAGTDFIFTQVGGDGWSVTNFPPATEDFYLGEVEYTLPPTGRIYTNVADQTIPNDQVNTYAVDLPAMIVGDLITVIVARGTRLFTCESRFLFFGQVTEFVFTAGQSAWTVEVVGTQLRVQSLGDGAQAVKAIFVER